MASFYGIFGSFSGVLASFYGIFVSFRVIFWCFGVISCHFGSFGPLGPVFWAIWPVRASIWPVRASILALLAVRPVKPVGGWPGYPTPYPRRVAYQRYTLASHPPSHHPTPPPLVRCTAAPLLAARLASGLVHQASFVYEPLASLYN